MWNVSGECIHGVLMF